MGGFLKSVENDERWNIDYATRQQLLNGKAGGSMKKIKQGVILLIVLSFVSLFNGCSLKDIKPYEDRLAEKKMSRNIICNR